MAIGAALTNAGWHPRKYALQAARFPAHRAATARQDGEVLAEVFARTPVR
jgi:hypothetical protein